MEEDKKNEDGMPEDPEFLDKFLASIRREFMRKITFPSSELWNQFVQDYGIFEMLVLRIKKNIGDKEEDIKEILLEMFSNKKTIGSIIFQVRKSPKKSTFEDFIALCIAYYQQIKIGKKTQYAKTQRKRDIYKEHCLDKIVKDNSAYKALIEKEKNEIYKAIFPWAIKSFENTEIKGKFCKNLGIAIISLYQEEVLPVISTKQEFGGLENYEKKIRPKLNQKFRKIRTGCTCKRTCDFSYCRALFHWRQAKIFLAKRLLDDFGDFYLD